MVDQWSLNILKLHGHYKNNVLPFAGGFYDQPNLFIQSMELIDSELSN